MREFLGELHKNYPTKKETFYFFNAPYYKYYNFEIMAYSWAKTASNFSKNKFISSVHFFKSSALGVFEYVLLMRVIIMENPSWEKVCPPVKTFRTCSDVAIIYDSSFFKLINSII